MCGGLAFAAFHVAYCLGTCQAEHDSPLAALHIAVCWPDLTVLHSVAVKQQPHTCPGRTLLLQCLARSEELCSKPQNRAAWDGSCRTVRPRQASKLHFVMRRP